MSEPKNEIAATPAQVKDRIGERVNEWTILGRSGKEWRCQCSCGKIQIRSRSVFKKYGPKSCGCKRGAMIAASKRTHGKTETPEYRVWCMMKTRCTNPKRRDYQWYGAKGITLCDRWINGDGERGGFECFLSDMGERPTPAHTIERKDGKKNYEPDNCCWLLIDAQQRNKSSNLLIEYKRKKMCAAEVAREIGMNQHTFVQRIRTGWSINAAIHTPLRKPSDKRGVNGLRIENGGFTTLDNLADQIDLI